ncbi:MAG TPA: nuclear transport factor 2 family protein [Novosphingobium sp.]|nr:nuclear transport factor 2 family protein [Novosphingobium sp.]
MNSLHAPDFEEVAARAQFSAVDLDRQRIRDLLESWVVWRDAAEWDRLATVWHEGAWMMTTWSRSPATEFIARSRAAFERGSEVLHMLGGSVIDVEGTRAVAQSKAEITQRAEVHGVLVDVHCKARFLDAFEKRDGRWGFVVRQPVYDLDRMSPVNPNDTLTLDEELLAQFPSGYRHLAYLQTMQGMEVYRDMPGTRGPELDALRQRMASWLAGEPASIFAQADIAAVKA